MQYHKSSVLANNNRYYFDGKSVSITSKHYKKYSPDYIKNKLEEYKSDNDYSFFNEYINKFIYANKEDSNSSVSH